MCAPSLTDSLDKVADNNINILFHEADARDDGKDLNARADAFYKLAEQFLVSLPKGWYRSEDLVVDGHGLRLMLGRFQRDAFSGGSFCRKLEFLERERKIDPAIAKELLADVLSLGLRVTSEKPRKTRIAAVFCLWMCAFRPASIAFLGDPEKDAGADKFCAQLNFWITSTYLKKFGSVIVGTQHTGPYIMGRILHDFTYRNVNLSSLELLYCSLFRASDPSH